MKDNFTILISNNRLKYHLTLESKITIIKGTSASGTTIFYQWVHDLWECNRNIGLDCNCREKLEILTNLTSWKQNLETLHNRIFVIDGSYDFVTTREFAAAVQNSDNYFIIISRSCRLRWLPCSDIKTYHFVSKKEGTLYCNVLTKEDKAVLCGVSKNNQEVEGVHCR